MNRHRQHFERGGRGVFSCECCGRRTRRVDQGGDSQCCSECWDLAGLDNEVNDRASPLTAVIRYRDYLVSRIATKGGNVQAVMRDFTYLWPKESDQ